jgi:hypothetical protein
MNDFSLFGYKNFLFSSKFSFFFLLSLWSFIFYRLSFVWKYLHWFIDSFVIWNLWDWRWGEVSLKLDYWKLNFCKFLRSSQILHTPPLALKISFIVGTTMILYNEQYSILWKIYTTINPAFMIHGYKVQSWISPLNNNLITKLIWKNLPTRLKT